jgi:hypothetical protein
VLGAISLVRSAWESAEESYQRALAIRERVSHADGIVESLIGLATVAERRGDWARAEQLALRALQVAQSIDPCPDQARPDRLLGRLYGRRGDAARAAEHLERARALVEPMAPTLELAPTLLALAEAHEHASAGEAARPSGPVSSALVARALGMAASAEVLIEVRTYAALLADGSRSDAESDLEARRISNLAQRSGAPRLLGLDRLAAARLALRRLDVTSAREAFEDAMHLMDSASCPYDLAIVARDYGRMQLEQARAPERGRALVASARRTFESLGARPDAEHCLRVLAGSSPDSH